jgi:hypothetical protein
VYEHAARTAHVNTLILRLCRNACEYQICIFTKEA